MPLIVQIDQQLKKDFHKNSHSIGQLKKLFKFIFKNIKNKKTFHELVELLGQVPKESTLLLCDDIQMRGFQKQYKNLNRTTDVLSFPTIEALEYADRNYLGDLIISLPAVARNAKRYRRSFEKELYLVFTHGVLHLVGYEHVGVSQKKAQEMKLLQEDLSKAFFQSIKNS
jgi:probable rRNA maturation factor